VCQEVGIRGVVNRIRDPLLNHRPIGPNSTDGLQVRSPSETGSGAGISISQAEQPAQPREPSQANPRERVHSVISSRRMKLPFATPVPARPTNSCRGRWRDASARVFALLCMCWAGGAFGYSYPVDDALLSTVIGTAVADQGATPDKIPARTYSIERFPEREVPKVFWNQNELRYSVAAQKKAAPLIFIVAGTGANYGSAKMLYLSRLFYGEGFHVISLSSPTDPNFILTASLSGHPGYTPEDSEDLYAVMKEAYATLNQEVEVSEVHLTGYSLGGTQSAFLTAIDDQEGAFHFKKILMINPSVDLFASVRILDGLFSYALPDGNSSVVALVERLLDQH
jgi:hypothetical protein